MEQIYLIIITHNVYYNTQKQSQCKSMKIGLATQNVNDHNKNAFFRNDKCFIIYIFDGVIIIIKAIMRRNLTALVRNLLAVQRKGIGYKVNQHFQQSVNSVNSTSSANNANPQPIAKQPIKKVYQNVPNKRASPSLQLYNSNLSYECGDTFTKFLILGPYYQRSQSNTKVSIKTKAAVSIRCIDKDKMYTKGSSYTMIDLSLRDVNRLLNIKFTPGQQFKVDLSTIQQQKWLKIFVQDAQQQQQPSLDNIIEGNQQKQQQQSINDIKLNQQWPKQMQQIIDAQKSDKPLDPTHIKFQVKSAKGTHEFQMPYPKFQSILKLIQQSLQCLYGVESAFQFQLNKLISKMERGEIQEQEYEIDPNRFSL